MLPWYAKAERARDHEIERRAGPLFAIALVIGLQIVEAAHLIEHTRGVVHGAQSMCIPSVGGSRKRQIREP